MSGTYWQQKTEALVASGQPIKLINAQRARSSLIKSGRLFKGYAGASVQIMAISDVQGDSLSVIGSGLADAKYINCQVSSEVVASNAMARAAIVAAAPLSRRRRLLPFGPRFCSCLILLLSFMVLTLLKIHEMIIMFYV